MINFQSYLKSQTIIDLSQVQCSVTTLNNHRFIAGSVFSNDTKPWQQHTSASNDAFGDLLSGQQFTSHVPAPKATLMEQRREELEKTMDPVKLKVMFDEEEKEETLYCYLDIKFQFNRCSDHRQDLSIRNKLCLEPIILRGPLPSVKEFLACLLPIYLGPCLFHPGIHEL